MFVIAENIKITNPSVSVALKGRDKEPLQALAKRLVAAGADALNVNLGAARHDGVELMVFVVETLSEAVHCPLCLDTSNRDALEAGIVRCREKGLPNPIINSFALQSGKIEAILPLAARYQCDIIGLTMETSIPVKVAERLELALELVAAANDAGVDNQHVLIDPVVLPLSATGGQEHAVAVREVVATLPGLFTPPVRSVCGISNISNGAPRELRPAIDSVYLAMLAAVGLDVVITNVLEPETMRTVRLVKAFRNQSLYAVSDAEIQ
jgi:5-methyltetrahydrofolate corrinoid/iron sulfur protein methyltransferase